VTLLDLNPNALATAEKTLKEAVSGLEPRTMLWDITQAMPLSPPPSPPSSISSSSDSLPTTYDSISLFYLLHCLPGPTSSKHSIFSRLKYILYPDGVLYGATILGKRMEGVKPGPHARFWIRFYNRVGVFGNDGDTKREIVEALREYFRDVETWVVGVVLLFRAEGVKV
jgi:hypothetical protein